jgi:hypothetical protein
MSTSKAQRAQTAERRTKAIAMRIAGAEWQQIADQLGYSSRGAACKDVTRALQARLAEQAASVDMLREVELMRLDALTREAWGVMKRPHLLISGGKVVKLVNEATGEERTLSDDKPILEAIDRLVKIAEQRRKLTPGLEVPTKIEADGEVRYEIVGVDLDKL